MKSTQRFLLSKPSERTDMVIQGYAHLGARFRLLSIEIKVLNDWVNQMPGLLADNGATLPEGDSLINAIEEFVHAGDSLTDSLVENAVSLEAMTKAITYYNKYGPSNS